MAWAEAEALFGLAQSQAEDFRPDQELPEVCKKACLTRNTLNHALPKAFLVLHSYILLTIGQCHTSFL